MSRLVAERPESGPPRPWRFPVFERREAEGGGTLLAASLPGQPLAAVTLVVDAGATAEPAGKEGVGLLTARLLGEGTEKRDAFAFAVAAERLGASWHADVGWDSLRVGFDLPVGALAEAVDLLAEAVRRPALSDLDFTRVRGDRLDELNVEWSQPGPRAGAAFADRLWDGSSRYARNDGGDLASVPTLELSDVQAFHRDRFAPSSATLVVAGDLAEADLDDLAARMFGGWQPATPTRSAPVVSERASGRRVVVVDRPGSVQSMLLQGHSGPPRRTPDYVPMTTMAVALGGLFTSRLNYTLREKKGYTYGAFAGYDLRRDGGVFTARAAVHTEVTAAAAAEAAAEVARMHAEGLEDSELDSVRSYRAGVFPIAFSSPYAVAGALGDLVVHGLPDDYFDTVREKVATVPRADVDRAARERLRPDDLLTVVVGDAATVADDLRAAGLGEVEVVTD